MKITRTIFENLLNIQRLKKINVKALKRRFWIFFKNIYWVVHFWQKPERRVLLVLGCQRSGTTMLLESFRHDIRSTIFTESSAISQLGQDPVNQFCLRPLDEVKAIFKNSTAPFIVAKPICDSQNCPDLLVNLKSSKALWIYRNYLDVVSSNVKMFQRQVDNIRVIVECEPNNWRSEKVSEASRLILSSYYSPNMSLEDAAALFWYVRNIFFFELSLSQNPYVMLCKYEDLVLDPKKMFERIYQFVEFPDPQSNIISNINANSVGRGGQVQLGKEIYKLCNDLWGRLNDTYKRQKI